MKKLVLVTSLASAMFLTGCQTTGVNTTQSTSTQPTFTGDKMFISHTAPYRGTDGRYTGMTGSGGSKPTGKLPKGWSYLIDGKNNKYCPGPEVKDDGTLVFTKTICTIPSGFSQRAQIESAVFSQNEVSKRVFEADISFNLDNKEAEEAIYGLNSLINITEVKGNLAKCGNPGQVVFSNLRFSNGAVVEYVQVKHGGWKTTTSGTRVCEDNKVWSEKEAAKNTIPVDGTEFNFRVEFDFKGGGNFDMNVFINNILTLKHTYVRPADKDPMASKYYMLQFGNYSAGLYDYTMKAKNLRWEKVDSF